MSSSRKPIRVTLVDDHPVVKMGLKGNLEQWGDFGVVGEASDGVEAVEAAGRLRPDFIAMDVMMPELDGIEACRTIMEKLPETQVMMLTASREKDAVIEAVGSRRDGLPAEALRRRGLGGNRSGHRSGPPENTGRGPEEDPGSGPR